MQIGVIVGSLRRGSFSRKLASALIARAPAGFDCELIEIADLPHAEAMMNGKDKPVSMQLRTTEVFRAEQGAWKLIHRHADLGRSGK